MGQVESSEAGLMAMALPSSLHLDPRSLQAFHGMRPELLQQLDDVRKLLKQLTGTDLGMDPLMDPGCTVHDAVSSLFSQYIEKVGLLSSSPARDSDSLAPVPFPQSASFSLLPLGSVTPAPASFSQLQALGAIPPRSGAASELACTNMHPPDGASRNGLPRLQEQSGLRTNSLTRVSLFAQGTDSSSTSTEGSSTSPTLFTTLSARSEATTPPSTPGQASKPIKRPLKRFSTGKWVSAVVKAMELTNNKSELARLEAGLQALARAEHDWLAAKLGAVAGHTLRLPPSSVEEVTAVGLALWVEFWSTWGGRPSVSGSRRNSVSRSESVIRSECMSRSNSVSRANGESNQHMTPKHGSSAASRRMQHGAGSGKGWNRSKSLEPERVWREGASSWKVKRPPPISVADRGPLRRGGAGEGAQCAGGLDSETAGDNGTARLSLGNGGTHFNLGNGSTDMGVGNGLEEGGYKEMTIEQKIEAEAAFYHVDLDGGAGERDESASTPGGSSNSRWNHETPGGSSREFDDIMPMSSDGEDASGFWVANKDSEHHQPGVNGIRGQEGSGAKDHGNEIGGPKAPLRSARCDDVEGNVPHHFPDSRGVGGGDENGGSKRQGLRYMDMENELRADIGARLQKTLLEECLLETYEVGKFPEDAPPAHAEVVRLLGLAASAASLQQASAAACVLKLLDGLGREWRGEDLRREWRGEESGREWRGEEAGAKAEEERTKGVPSGCSGGIPRDWDRLLETKECRGFVLQCLVDLLEACALQCKSRYTDGIAFSGEGVTPTGQVHRLESFGEDELGMMMAERGLLRNLPMAERMPGESNMHSHTIPMHAGSSRRDSAEMAEEDERLSGGGKSSLLLEQDNETGWSQRMPQSSVWESGSTQGRDALERGTREHFCPLVGAPNVSTREDQGCGVEAGVYAPSPASLVELAEASLVWQALNRKDLNEAERFQELDRLFLKPVGPGILALAIADQAQKLHHLSTQDLWALSDSVEDLACHEAAFRLRLKAIAGEYEDLDAVVEVVRLAYQTRGIESVPLRLKRLVSTARFALTHAPNASARHDYAMTFGACMLEPLLEDPAYPWAFEIADNYVGLSGLLGPVENGEKADVQRRTKLLCARIIMKSVVDPLLVDLHLDEDSSSLDAHAGGLGLGFKANADAGGLGVHADAALPLSITKASAEGGSTKLLTRKLLGRMSGQGEGVEREERLKRKRRKERALLAWAESVDFPGIEIGWLQWQAIGTLLQIQNMNHCALVTMWAKALRGNFKAITEEGSSTDKDALELFDWGLEGLLITYASDPPSESHSLSHSSSSACPSPLPSPSSQGEVASANLGNQSEQNRKRDGGGKSEGGADRSASMPLKVLSGNTDLGKLTFRTHLSKGEQEEGLEDTKCDIFEAQQQCSTWSHDSSSAHDPSSDQDRDHNQKGAECPADDSSGLPFACDWLMSILDQVRPRDKDKVELLLAVASRMAGAIYWKWPKRKDNQRYIARILVYAHTVLGFNQEQKQRAMRIGERVWGWMLPSAALVRDQCESDEEAAEIMENAICATWLGAA